MVHVGLHSVGTYHKKFGWENKKIKIFFAECQRMALGKHALPSVRHGTLVKDNGRQLYTAADGPLPSGAVHRVFGTRQICLCRVSFCAESPTLGKRGHYREQEFVECGTR
jgi:hypothetical protein